MFFIGKTESASLWNINFGFHEGISFTINRLAATSRLNTFHVEIGPGVTNYREEHFFTYSNREKGHLIWESDESTSRTVQEYVRVDSTFSFENIVLGGVYRDSTNRIYQFQGSKAIWPDTVFDFKLGLDSFGFQCDYIEATHTTSNLRYAFELIGNKLSLYNMHHDQEGIELLRDSTPFLVLHHTK